MDYPTQSVIPLISLDTEPPDFDYAAFLQGEDDIDYLAEESSASGTSNTLTDGSIQTLVPFPPGNQSSPTNSAGNSPPKQRLERRGHTKSRRGCFNCKRRRIKVSGETKAGLPGGGHERAAHQRNDRTNERRQTRSVKKLGRHVVTA